MAQLFDELRIQQEAEFSVRVSYLELYNEEIFDLLSAADDTTRLRLYEDSTKKGSVIIQVCSFIICILLFIPTSGFATTHVMVSVRHPITY